MSLLRRVQHLELTHKILVFSHSMGYVETPETKKHCPAKSYIKLTFLTPVIHEAVQLLFLCY